MKNIHLIERRLAADRLRLEELGPDVTNCEFLKKRYAVALEQVIYKGRIEALLWVLNRREPCRP